MELYGLHLQERIAVMPDKKAKKKLCDATLRSVKKQLAKPRVSKSARKRKKSGTKAGNHEANPPMKTAGSRAAAAWFLPFYGEINPTCPAQHIFRLRRAARRVGAATP